MIDWEYKKQTKQEEARRKWEEINKTNKAENTPMKEIGKEQKRKRNREDISGRRSVEKRC